LISDAPEWTYLHQQPGTWVVGVSEITSRARTRRVSVGAMWHPLDCTAILHLLPRARARPTWLSYPCARPRPQRNPDTASTIPPSHNPTLHPISHISLPLAILYTLHLVRPRSSLASQLNQLVFHAMYVPRAPPTRRFTAAPVFPRGHRTHIVQPRYSLSNLSPVAMERRADPPGRLSLMTRTSPPAPAREAAPRRRRGARAPTCRRTR
jgi:hypothetical protein